MTSTPEVFHKPCPNRILDEIGYGFVFGAIYGSCFHFIKSSFNSPRGQRLRSGLTAVRMNAPRNGGTLAAWHVVYSVCECTTVYLRQKQESWNSIISGAVTGGFMYVRQGPGPVARGVVFGGCLLALIEGGGIMLTRSLNTKQLPQVISDDEAPGREKVGTTPSWFDGTDKEVLESFDSAVPPTFDFKSS